MWIFEPHVAEGVYEAWVKEMDIPIVRDAWLNRENGVRKQGSRIVSITTLDGETYEGAMFIDATYEGDLMAAAGVDFHVGRESNATYGETWNGVQTGVLHHRHHFGVLKTPISPIPTMQRTVPYAFALTRCWMSTRRQNLSFMIVGST